MEFVRKIVNSMDLKDVVKIPNSLINKKVEVLIFPVEDISNNREKRKALLESYQNMQI